MNNNSKEASQPETPKSVQEGGFLPEWAVLNFVTNSNYEKAKTKKPDQTLSEYVHNLQQAKQEVMRIRAAEALNFIHANLQSTEQ